jgi:hypothetical protein
MLISLAGSLKLAEENQDQQDDENEAQPAAAIGNLRCIATPN